MRAWLQAGVVLLAVSLGSGVLEAPSVVGQAPPDPLTTDGTEYCAHLIERLQRAERDRDTPPPKETALLANEGQLLCEHGQPRLGILRLRRAMQILLRPPHPRD